MKVESKNTVMANWTLNELNSGIGKALKSEIRNNVKIRISNEQNTFGIGLVALINCLNLGFLKFEFV
jgi:hypothetical protein